MLRRYLLDKATEDTHAFVENKYCIKKRSKTHICSICQKNCPVDAITVNKVNVKVDGKKCLSCNICNASCPGKAFHLKRFDYSKFIKQAKSKDKIILGCHIGQGEGNIFFPCLNSFPVDFLTAFLLINRNKEMYFNLTNCKDCSVKSGYALFTHNLMIATKFLAVFDIKIKNKSLYSGAIFPVYSREDDLSRKELFSYLKDETKQLAINTAFDIVGDKKNDLSLERRLLINALKRITTQENKTRKVSTNISFLKNMIVSSSCNACGVCQAICPRKAWLIENKGEVVSIKHNVKSCISCGLCSDRCPNKAIRNDGFQLSLLAEDFINKRDLPLTKCTKCRNMFVAQAKDQLCSSCEKRERLRESLKKI